MDSSTEVVEAHSNIIVKDKLPMALPLLPRGRLLSQPPRSVLELQPACIQQPLAEETQQQQLADTSTPPQRKSIMLGRLSELLEQPQRIAYNILPSDDYATNDRSFGFHYFDKELERPLPKRVENTAMIHSISFESRFESGNLLLAYEYSSDHYLLVLRPDYNTMCYCQWFYFQATNESTEEKEVTFSIVNMTKSSSLFSHGMKVIALEQGTISWVRTGKDISYTANQFPRSYGRYHTLSWRTTLRPGQPIRFAYSQPYLYSNLNMYLDTLELIPIVKRSVLCRTMLNNRVDLLTISSGSLENKKVIVIISRTHPAETVGSFVMSGVIDFLISQRVQAKLLRQKFVFKLVPMVNPDGVVLGSSRCSLRGVDLNRTWGKPNRSTDPQIFHLKKMIMAYARSDRLVMFCDLHGHSKKKNIFAYGCHDRSQPHASRQLPYILSKIHGSFSFNDCNFAISSTKQGTARVSLWRKLRIPNIFTFQSSFCSAENSNLHIDEKGYREMGEDLCKAINIYFSSRGDFKRDKNEPSAEAYKLLSNMRDQMLKQMHRTKDILKIGMEDTSGSQSEEENDNIYKNIKEGTVSTRQRPIELYVSRDEQQTLKTQRSELLSYHLRKETQSSQAVQQTSITEHLKTQKVTSKKHLLNRKYLLRRQNNANSFKLDRETRCLSENFTGDRSEHRPRLIELKTSFKQKLKLTTHIERSEQKISKYVPQFVNFNFQEKFRKTTLEAQFRSKLARQNRDSMLIEETTEKFPTSSKEQGLIRCLQSKKDEDKREHRSFIDLNKKQQPIGSRLEALLRRAYK